MRRSALCLLFLALALPARSVIAGTYHVDPNTGNDSNTGTSHASAWKSITKANTVSPGSVVYLWPGSHSGLPSPNVAPTGGLRFTFIGASANGDPVRDTLARATIKVPGGTLSKPYVVFKGFTVTSTLTLSESADRDSILSITCEGSWSNQGGDYNVYANCKYKGPSWNLNKGVLGSSDGVQLYNNDFPYLGKGATGAVDHICLTWNADSTVEMFDRKLITVEAGLDGGLGAEWHFDDRNRISRNNYTSIQLNQNCYAIWRWRTDAGVNIGSYNNRFDRDTIICTGVGGSFLPSSSASCGTGDYLAQCVGSWNVFMDSCFVNASGTSGTTEMYWQGGMHGWHLSNTVIAMNGSAIHAFDVHDGCSVSNCTLSGVSPVRWTDEYSRPVWGPGDMTFNNNVVYSWSGSAVSFASRLSVVGAYLADRNLFWGGGKIPVLLGSDPNSKYGDPMFVVPVKGPTHDPHLLLGSPAINLVAPGVDAGAFGGGGQAPPPPGPDTQPPAAITDLR